MITSFEVASIFRIKDEATLTLKKMTEEVRAFQMEVKEAQENLAAMGRLRLTGLGTRLKGLTDQADKMSSAFGTTFATMDKGVATSTAEVRLLAAEWRSVAAAATAASRATRTVGTAGGNPRQRIAGSHGGGRGFHVSSPGVPLPGGMHARFRGAGNAPLMAAGAAGYSIYEALEVGDVVSKGLANVYPEGLPSNFDAQKDELTKKIIEEAAITKLPLGVVAKMAMDEIRTNANQPWAARMRMLPLVIESAAREAYQKGTSPESATSAFVGQLHQIRAFTPAEIEKYGPMLAFFASKDPNSLVNIAKSAAYHSPIATTMLGIPIEQDLAAQTVLDRTGVGGKSGTWLREMVTRAAKPVHDKSYVAKMKRLQEFGLMDAAERPTWMTDGHYDEAKMLHILADHLKDVPIEERAGKLKQIFGERGAGAVALMTDPKMLQQYDELLKESHDIMANKDWWAQQNATNPMQKMKGAMVDAQIAALAAGQVLTPPAVGAAAAAASVLGWAAGILPAPGSAGEKRGEKMGEWGGIGAVIGGVLGIPGGPAGIAGGALLGGSVGGEVGYLIGTFKILDDAAKGAAGALEFLWKYGPGSGGRDAMPADPKKQSWNVIPPPSGEQTIQVATTINVDGRKLAEVVTKHQARDGAGPAEGAPYHDSTHSVAPVDFSVFS
jgi:hypothetical protein